MYIPKHYKWDDNDAVIQFMQRYSFAIIISAADNKPIATHLPFVVNNKDGKLTLTSHMAKVNPQWKELVEKDVLVIFNEPHAYISPTHYNSTVNVPTWNYLSVHAYGKATLIEGDQGAIEVLEEMINTYEPEFIPQWNGLPEGYRNPMLREIVAFTIEVTELQAKHKLSQNKKGDERQRIVDALSNSDDTTANDVAEYMRKL